MMIQMSKVLFLKMMNNLRFNIKTYVHIYLIMQFDVFLFSYNTCFSILNRYIRYIYT